MSILLTVDVEVYDGNYESAVFGGGHGLDYLLSRLLAYGLRATFFVETLGATQWGGRSIEDVCCQIMEAGQEVQLHVHPEVGRLPGVEARSHLASYSGEEQYQLIQRGLEILIQCGAENVTAFRAGDLAANEDTLKAMNRVGLQIGSNRDRDTKSSVLSGLNNSFPIPNDISKQNGIIDVPVSSLESAIPFLDGRYRHLNITAVGSSELCDALFRMQRASYTCATLLTHPQEFFFRKGSKYIPNSKNRGRLESLLRYIVSTPGINCATVGECRDIAIPTTSPPDLRLNLGFSLLRVLSQGWARIKGWPCLVG